MLFEPGSIADCINERLERLRWRKSEGAACGSLFWRRHLKDIVDTINWANSPSRAMTEREHKACRRLSRYCHKRLQEFMPYGITEDGLYYVK